MEKELTPKQQTSEAIRQAETILIMTGQHPGIDQVAGTLALAAILRKFGKKVTVAMSDDIPAGARFLPANLIERTLNGLRDFMMQVDLSHAEVDKLKYDIEGGKLNIHVTPFAGSLQPRDVSFSHGDFHFDLVIILGVASYNRLDRLFLQNAEMLRQAPLVNIDFHRNNEQYGAINLVEGGAASLAEILMALSESLQPGMIDESIATTMLAGIMAATDRFTSYHTTAKTMTVAAQMMALGADQQKIVKGLYRIDRDNRADRGESRTDRQERERSVDRPDKRPQSAALQKALSELAPKKEDPKPAETKTETKDEAVKPAPESESSESYGEPELPTVAPAKPAADSPAATEPLPPLSLESVSEIVKPPEPSAPSPQTPSADDAPTMEELLPPHHIEMSPSEPAAEPTESQPAQPATNPLAADKAANPTNNPVFYHRRSRR